MLQSIEEKAMNGQGATVDEALMLDQQCTTDQLCRAADRVRLARLGNRVDTCSIVNARSGRCTEDCKWCAQSRHFKTGVKEYDIVDTEALLETARCNDRRGVARFSLVTSGRRVSRADIGTFCDMYRKIGRETGLYLCASMGLLDRECLQALHDAGVRRYHCNLETSASFFPTLCSSHTRADKLATIKAAREVGMEVCSGGIIGMGETMRQRLEMTAEAVAAGACSIPMNILSPIPGTPLEHTPPIGEDEIVRTAALMRLVAPDCDIRFAGGRKRLSPATVKKMLRGGINGALVGDMLTTVGNKMDEDFSTFAEAGYDVNTSE